ncbi:MAG: AAA family ATPase [Pseudobdellovibrio sp.]
MEFDSALKNIDSVFENVKKVIVGKDKQILQAISCWLAGGHLLIDDVPGTGKTFLARSLALSVEVPFSRVQFTPDLLPSDIIGSSIYRQDRGSFEFIPGPLFTTVLLADEINRATPRTQSALLEAMSERQVSAEGKTSQLDNLFFTIATQNPLDQLGTFILPEAQLDRFMMKMSLGYPQRTEEIKILKDQNDSHPIHSLGPVISREDWVETAKLVSQVKVNDVVLNYIMTVVGLTRMRPEIKVGASTRAALALKRAAQAAALVEGVDFVDPSHVFELIVPVIGHRLILSTEAKISNRTVNKVLEDIRAEVAVPTRKK